MDIDKMLKVLEEDHIEKDLKELSPKDRLNFWAQLKEFRTPKIQRALFEPLQSNEHEILIRYEYDKTTAHQSIPEPLDQSEKD